MTNREAKEKAVELITGCFLSEEAGGFEGCGFDEETWIELVSSIHSTTERSFSLRIGKWDVNFYTTATRVETTP
jgi:hypothetical protein